MLRRLICVFALLFAATPAFAGLTVRIDLSAQRMSVRADDGTAYEWTISSGRLGYLTPNGTYRPQRLERSWYSRKYGGAMPYSVFFRGGYAIHGTTAIGRLGQPASHGCIRLHPSNAATLFNLVRRHGFGGTRIVITGSAYGGRRIAQQAEARPTARRTAVRAESAPTKARQPIASREATRPARAASPGRAGSERSGMRQYMVYVAVWRPGVGYVYEPSHTVWRAR